MVYHENRWISRLVVLEHTVRGWVRVNSDKNRRIFALEWKWRESEAQPETANIVRYSFRKFQVEQNIGTKPRIVPHPILAFFPSSSPHFQAGQLASPFSYLCNPWNCVRNENDALFRWGSLNRPRLRYECFLSPYVKGCFSRLVIEGCFFVKKHEPALILLFFLKFFFLRIF